MHFTDHTDFGLRVLVMLATVAPERVSTQVLAERHGLSYTHVQKVVQSLQSAGFVETFRGRGGGVQLARDPDDITVGAVVRALEPGFHLAECFRPGGSRCRLIGGCGLTHVLDRGLQAMFAELDRVTLASVVAESPGVASLRSA